MKDVIQIAVARDQGKTRAIVLLLTIKELTSREKQEVRLPYNS